MEKGTTNNSAGRPKGVPNKSTSKAREAIAKFVDKNQHRLEKWLDRIAEDNPKDAFDCVMKVMEYHLPKLARSEQTGLDGDAIQNKLTIVHAIKHLPNSQNDSSVIDVTVNQADNADNTYISTASSSRDNP